MNILYCGDSNIIDGLIMSILSIVNNTKVDLNIYVLTMNYEDKNKKFKPISTNTIKKIEKELRKIRKNININLLNITNIAHKCLPTANLSTRFTPYCMLRLYADQIPNLPEKILYLDTDVIALKDPIELYNIDITNYDLAGVLDNYGQHFYRKNILFKDYLNSGVLLLNMNNIKKHKVFEKSRIRCQNKKMLLPDQASINKYAKNKLILETKYNDQSKIKEETIFRHFTTTFKFIPTFHIQTVKPWDIDKLHNILNISILDNLYNEYKDIKRRIS